MKKNSFLTCAGCIIICFGLLLPAVTNSQAALNPADLTTPFVPGERGLKFKLAIGSNNADNVEAWVFYSKTSSELNTLNASSFGSTKHYGRSVMVKTGSTVQCTFVFPHTFHSSTPCADLFASMFSVSGLVKSGFPVPQITSGIPIPGISTTSAQKIDFNPVIVNKGECVFYRIYKRTKSGSSFNDEISEIKRFRMPDSFNIGIAGDSYGAGEGAPDDEFELTGNNSDMWISCKCHRSKKSGMLKGVKKFIANYPDIAIDYSFQACSGAVTDEFFRTQQVTNTHPPGTALYTSDCGGSNNAIQFQTIRNDLITNRKHDAVNMLLMSGGGNNTGFGDVVVQYLLAPLNLAALNSAGNLLHIDVLGEFKDQLDQLPDDYEAVDQGINDFFSEVRPIIGITTYPDPTKGLNGRCGSTSIAGPLYPCALYENDFSVSPRAEYQLIHDDFLVPLNNRVKGTTSLGWNFIDVEGESGNHGLCNCDEPYFNAIDASYDEQGDIYGIVHPNKDGYKEMYRDKIYSFVATKYAQYQASYALAVLFGMIPTPATCESSVRMINVVNRLKELSPVVTTLKGFEGLPTDLSGSAFIDNGDDDAKAVSPAFASLRSNTSYKSAFNNLAVKNSVVKPLAAPKVVRPARPISPQILKLRAEIKTFAASKEFQEKLKEIRKQVPVKKPVQADPLDNLFQNE